MINNYCFSVALLQGGLNALSLPLFSLVDEQKGFLIGMDHRQNPFDRQVAVKNAYIKALIHYHYSHGIHSNHSIPEGQV